MPTTLDRCARPTCEHTRVHHSNLSGCLVQAGPGYCSCQEFVEARVTAPAPMPTPGGVTFVQEIDGVRLNKQQQAVYTLMRDGRFRTLREIADLTGFPEASVSARLRDFRKAPLNRDVQRRRRTDAGGTWEYAVLNDEA